MLMRLVRSRVTLLVALLAALLLVAAACSDDDSSSESSTTGDGVSVTIADKGFTESFTVAQIYAILLGNQGFDTNVESLGSTEIADAAITGGEIDLYPEYTGTSFLNVLGRDGADAADLSREEVYEEVDTAYADRGLATLPPAPYNNGNEVACTTEAAEEFNLETLSDLGRESGNLSYSTNAEHLTRDDGLPLLRSEYGVEFDNVRTVDISLRYQPIENGQAECVYAFGTDPQLAQLDLVVLEDDQGAFSAGVPFQNFAVINADFYEGLTDAQRTAFDEAVAAGHEVLTAESVRQLNDSVESDMQEPADVANDFLREQGLIS